MAEIRQQPAENMKDKNQDIRMTDIGNEDPIIWVTYRIIDYFSRGNYQEEGKMVMSLQFDPLLIRNSPLV